jgi:hypothetical protein
MPDTQITPCRAVTADEAAHYRENGWVMLRKFVDPAMLGTVLTIAKSVMGEDGDSNPPYGIDQPYFNAMLGGLHANAEVRPLFGGIGQAAKVLDGRKSNPGVRLFNEFYAPKLPAAKKTINMGNGPTSFHQDFITFAVDRSGGMTFWMPLESYGPDAGTMSFINGSHRLGILGNYTAYDGRDIREVWPELNDLQMSEPMTYELGDITVHDHRTVHGAGKNAMDRPRWAYLVLPQPADARWNGAPPEAFDPAAHGMKPYGMFPDEGFPIIA